MQRLGQLVASVMVSISLVASSTAAVAQTSAPMAAPASSGWMALSMLAPDGAALAGTSSLAAAQPDNIPPPPPPPAYARPGMPPIPVMLVWLATIGVIVYIATKGSHSVHANSPA